MRRHHRMRKIFDFDNAAVFLLLLSLVHTSAFQTLLRPFMPASMEKGESVRSQFSHLSVALPRARARLSVSMSGNSRLIKLQQMHTRFKALKVAELRELMSQYGENAAKLKKGEIIERLIQLTEERGSPFEKPEFWSKPSTQPESTQFVPRKTVQDSARSVESVRDQERGAANERIAEDRKLVRPRNAEDTNIAPPVPARQGSLRSSPAEAGAERTQLPETPESPDEGKEGRGRRKRLPPSAAELEQSELDDLYSQNDGQSSVYVDAKVPFKEFDLEAQNRPSESRDTGADMELTFLGTASCLPSLTRGVSSIVLRRSNRKQSSGTSSWVFDAGESTQVQVQKSWVRPSAIDKIFITHLHGDHSFGIVGLMCLIGQNRDRDDPLVLYGPAGLRALIRSTLQLTCSRAVPFYRVVELHDIPFLHGRYMRAPASACDGLEPPYDRRFKEVDEGDDIFPTAQGHWNVCKEEDGTTVQAAAMQHTMPCVGYVVQEPRAESRLLIEKIEGIVEENKEGLRKKYGNNYKQIYKDIKKLGMNDKFEFPNGDIISGQDVLLPSKPGRKIVILGDTCDSSAILPLAQDADIVVHEATNSWIPGMDEKSMEEVERDTIAHGHSTPQMAGRFARACRAKQLILTHFSPRYRYDSSDFCTRIMQRIEKYAAKESMLDEDDVKAAYDLMTLALKRPGYEDSESSFS